MQGLAALARGRRWMGCAPSWPFRRTAPARDWPLALAGTLVDPSGSSIRLPSPRARRACHPIDQWLRLRERVAGSRFRFDDSAVGRSLPLQGGHTPRNFRSHSTKSARGSTYRADRDTLAATGTAGRRLSWAMVAINELRWVQQGSTRHEWTTRA